MHYSVLVISKDRELLDEQMAPFDEEIRVDPYPVELDWMSTPDKVRASNAKYIAQHAAWVAAGRPKSENEWDNTYRANVAIDKGEWAFPAPNADDLTVMRQYHSDEDGNVFLGDDGKWYQMSTWNPKAQWDYWRIGGRYAGRFVAKRPTNAVMGERSYEWEPQFNNGKDDWPGNLPYNVCDQVQKSNVDWEAMGLMQMEKARQWWAEGQQWLKDHPDDWQYLNIMWAIDPSMDEESYVRDHVKFTIYAVLTKDGEWLEQQNAKYDDPDRVQHQTALDAEWRATLKRLMDEADDDDWYTVVDIHS